MKISIVIPTYNEKENIVKLIPKISQIIKKNKLEVTIIIVDDNSPDGTGFLADKLSKLYPINVVHRFENKGYGNSIIAGINKAIEINSEIIITMDADFSHDPKIIPLMIKQILEGYEVVIGSRRVSGGKIINWNLWRHFCSYGATNFSRLILNMKTKDITSGYRAYKTESIKKIPLNQIKSNGYSFLEEFMYYIEKRKLKIKEIPIVFVDRKYGKSKLTKKEIIKFFQTIWRIKFKNVK